MSKPTAKALREMIDNYIAADEEIKKIERYKNKLKEQIIAMGEGEHTGNVGQCTVTASETSRLDNTLLKEKFGEALVDCYKTTKSITVRISKFDKE